MATANEVGLAVENLDIADLKATIPPRRFMIP
jgi:hypothetical protein